LEQNHLSDIAKIGRIVIPKSTGGYRLAMHIYNISIAQHQSHAADSNEIKNHAFAQEIMHSRKDIMLKTFRQNPILLE
jgi:hypothetical protein